MKYFCGCDLGSATGKAVIIDEKNILGWSVIRSTGGPERTATVVFDEALAKAGLAKEDIIGVMGTGYGRESVSFIPQNMSEISCHAKGALWLNPNIHTVIDIGGQDSKVISLSDNGRVLDFQMNDKCGAGTGRFFEAMCRILDCTLQELAEHSLQATQPAIISKQCGIFAESEVITLINKGISINDIAAGLHSSVARRIFSMCNKTGLTSEVVVTGGCAKNLALIHCLEEVMGFPICTLPIDPQVTGALGAALYARETSGIL